MISVLTGNDKSPGFRSCTKKHALQTYKEKIKEGHLGDLVNEDGKFPHNLTSQMKFVAAMYFKLYRVEIKSLGLDWASSVSEDFINLQLLREVGIKKFKEKAFMYVPAQGVLSAAFKGITYQVLEYDQIFQKVPEYPDLLNMDLKKLVMV